MNLIDIPMSWPIEPGCVVECIDHRGLEDYICEGLEYTVLFTELQGFALRIHGVNFPVNAGRFVYVGRLTDPFYLDDGPYECDH
jgi:hypothetical protein